MDIARRVASSSYCKRRQVGCVIVKDDNIIAIGYNGTISGFENNCEENGLTKRDVLHAETNAIAKCCKSTYSSDGASMFITLSPCYDCAKLIIQAGIKNVYYIDKYTDTTGIDLLIKANINVSQVIY